METSTAIKDWQDRQRLYTARQWETLQPHINENLVALRGLVRSRPELPAFAQHVRNYGATVADPATKESFVSTAGKIATYSHRESVLETALVTADDLIRNATQAEERAALRDPEVAKDFVREALVTKPRFGPKVSSEQCDEILGFNDEVRPAEDKVVLCAEIIYLRSGTLTAEGIYDWLTETHPTGDQTPLQIINQGTDEMNASLLSWVETAQH